MKSSKSVKSKQLLLSGLVALVLIAGYYRWTVDTEENVLPVINEMLPEENSEIAKIETSVTDKKNTATEENTEIDNDADVKEASDGEMNYFEKSKYERDLTRSESVAMLQELAEENSDEEEKRKTQEKISEAAIRSEKESIIENLIISKGFKDCVVFMNDGVINVVVKTDKLEAKSVNQIKDIILSQTDYKASQIRISANKG